MFNHNFNTASIFCRWNKSAFPFYKSFRRKFFTGRRIKFTFSPFSFSSSSVKGLKERLPAIASAVVNSGKPQMQVFRITIISFSKIPVERSYNCISFTCFNIHSFPHTNTGTTGICKISPPKSVKSF
jgi:hypothetical protein